MAQKVKCVLHRNGSCLGEVDVELIPDKSGVRCGGFVHPPGLGPQDEVGYSLQIGDRLIPIVIERSSVIIRFSSVKNEWPAE